LAALPLDDAARAAAGLPPAGRAGRIARGLLPLLPWAAGGTAAMIAGDAAAYTPLFDSAYRRICEAYRFGKGVIYVLAGIGVLIFGAFAMLGRFDFGRFFALAGGIFIASSAEQLIALLGGYTSGCGATFMGGEGIEPPAGAGIGGI
jgi:type IV secretory pathway VirB2 component (pilin)